MGKSHRCFTWFCVGWLVLSSMSAFALEGDVNRDGEVDAADILLIQKNWKKGLGNGDYAGSEKCALCHREIYEEWSSTLHSQIYRASDEYANTKVIPDWTGQVSVSSGVYTVTGTLEMRGDHEYWVTIHFNDGDRDFRIDRVHGGIAIDSNEDPRSPTKPGHSKYLGKQRYQTKIGDGYYILPFQYNPIPDLDGKNGEWVAYHPDHWVDESGNYVLNLKTRSEEKRCAGCHQTGVKPSFDDGSQQFAHNASEPNISCENCHGPGGRHVATQDPEDIINPAHLPTTQQQTEVCGQCHARGNSVDQVAGENLDYPYANGRTFRPGDNLADLYDFNRDANHWPDGTSQRHHQQYEDFLRSHHYEAGMTCWACHDPHGTDNEHDLVASARDNSLCLRCHDAEHAEESHTHHGAPADDNNNPRCVDCHMPTVQKSAVRWDIHAHTFNVMLPTKTLTYQNEESGVPNSCAFCHRSENGATDTDISVWNAPEDIAIATYLNGFAESWWGDEEIPEPVPDPNAGYLGSDTCLGCHNNSSIVSDTEPAEGWLNSLHSQIYRDPAAANAEFLQPADEWTGQVSVSSGGLSVTATLEIRNGNERWFVIHFADGDREYKVDRVHGGHAVAENLDPRYPGNDRPGHSQYIGKQRYHTKIGEGYYILPFQYNPVADLDGKNREWVAYHLGDWVDAAGNFHLDLTTASEERRCAGCHQQGVDPSLTFNAVVSATQYQHNAAAPNIGCENCHGPGGNHIANTDKPSGERGIILPTLFENPERRLEVCGQCHTRGSSVGTLGGKTFGYPFNGERTYIPGDILSEFYTDGGNDWPDGTSSSHHQQYLDFLSSKHWTVARMECWVCHDPHGSTNEHDLRVSARDNGLCLQCHEGMDDPSHTHHGPVADDNGNPRCVDCHMPSLQKSGVRFDIHAHTFEVLLPEDTLAFKDAGSGQPNACGICHRSKDGWVDDDISVWNQAADIAIATILDGYVKQWWPGALAKEADGKPVKVFLGEAQAED